jgi:hypothetical protein
MMVNDVIAYSWSWMSISRLLHRNGAPIKAKVRWQERSTALKPAVVRRTA